MIITSFHFKEILVSWNLKGQPTSGACPRPAAHTLGDPRSNVKGPASPFPQATTGHPRLSLLATYEAAAAAGGVPAGGDGAAGAIAQEVGAALAQAQEQAGVLLRLRS